MFIFANRIYPAFLLSVLTFCSLSDAESATVYAVTGGHGGQAVNSADRDAESVLYRINQDSGVATLIGATGVTQFTSLAFDPVSKQLYGHQNNRTYNPDTASDGDSFGFLHRIDTSTGQTQLIGGTNSQISDISFDSSGQLHGWMQFTYVEPETATNDRLLRIDKSSGLVTDFLSGFGSNQTGLAFTPNGNLFTKSGNYAGQTDFSVGGIHQVAPGTGLPNGMVKDTLLGPLSTLAALSNGSALTVVRDASNAPVVRSALGLIDLNSGNFMFGEEITDQDSNPLVITAIAVAIPEPATVSAMACILFAWQFRRRRRPIRRN